MPSHESLETHLAEWLVDIQQMSHKMLQSTYRLNPERDR